MAEKTGGSKRKREVTKENGGKPTPRIMRSYAAEERVKEEDMERE